MLFFISYRCHFGSRKETWLVFTVARLSFISFDVLVQFEMSFLVMSSKKTTFPDGTIIEEVKIVSRDDSDQPKKRQKTKTHEQSCSGCGQSLPGETLNLDKHCHNCNKYWCGDMCGPMKERCECGFKFPEF